MLATIAYMGYTDMTKTGRFLPSKSLYSIDYIHKYKQMNQGVV